MIRKPEHFEITDRYIDSELSEAELNQFEAQLEIDSELSEELNLQLDVQNALQENDIINLRQNIARITQNQASQEMDFVCEAFNFGLTEEFSSFQNLDRQAFTKDINAFEHSFPKIHLYQHKIAGKENIHQFYKEQFESERSSEDEYFSSFDENLFSEIQLALEEDDITDIRANLAQIAKNVPAHQFSNEDIDNYFNNSMSQELRTQFENELTVNTSLNIDLKLAREINLACNETDIMELRNKLKNIGRSELRTTNIEEIEAYLENNLGEEELSAFEAEILNNRELANEIELIRNIDQALQENEVMQLRDKLQTIAARINNDTQTQRSFIGRFKARKVIVSTVAASLIMLLSITGLVSRNDSASEIYQRYHQTYQTTGIARSAASEENKLLKSALQKLENKDFAPAIELFRQVNHTDQNNMVSHFYSGVALQETQRFKLAIDEFNTVIKHKDNLFVEQAQWFVALCYLKTEDKTKAYTQFKDIAEKQGFYQEKASAILRKLDYSQN